MPTLAHQLADRIHRLRYEDLSPTAIEWIRTAFIDTIACTLAGIVDDGPRILRRVPGIAAAPGPSLIYASRTRTSPLDATLVNGTASHALDYDDVSGVLGGHPSVMLIPPMLALAELVGANGHALALAYVVGYETACRIAPRRALPPLRQRLAPDRHARHLRHGRRGRPPAPLHPRPDRDGDRVWRLLSRAGLKANFGTMTKPLHVGHAIRERTVRGADGAARVSPPIPPRLEAKQGFLDVFNGPGTYNVERMLANWYAPLEVEGGGEPGLKPYPCCGSAHASINRMIHLADAP